MKAAQVSALLGRPLTPTESSNFDLYLSIATESLESMLCTTLCSQDDPRVYDVREGYSTVFTDIFTDIEEVKLDGEVVDSSDYSVRQWDKRNADWYNCIVFDRRMTCEDSEVEISAAWGFQAMPKDLQYVLAALFGLVSKKSALDPTVQNKRVEDFSITFRPDADLDTDFYKKHAGTLRRYGLCNVQFMRHGEVSDEYSL